MFPPDPAAYEKSNARMRMPAAAMSGASRVILYPSLFEKRPWLNMTAVSPSVPDPYILPGSLRPGLLVK